jgi:hypothetical protein
MIVFPKNSGFQIGERSVSGTKPGSNAVAPSKNSRLFG